jgi:predicted amidohydrolase
MGGHGDDGKGDTMTSDRKTFRIAAVQMDSGPDREANIEEAFCCIDDAAAAGADVICLPEHMDVLPSMPAPSDIDTVPGYLTHLMAEKAREHQVHIHAGSLYEQVGSGNRAANTSVVIAPDGQVIASYRKLHMFDITLADGTQIRESEEVAPGNDTVTVQTTLGTWGLAICYDLRFGELFRLLALAGAQVIFVPANFTDPTGQAHWEPLLRARAIENGCYIVATDQCGDKPRFKAHGHSLIIDPWGQVLAEAGDGPEIIFADIDLGYVDEVRAKLPSLANRRTDVYHLARISEGSPLGDDRDR